MPLNLMGGSGLGEQKAVDAPIVNGRGKGKGKGKKRDLVQQRRDSLAYKPIPYRLLTNFFRVVSVFSTSL